MEEFENHEEQTIFQLSFKSSFMKSEILLPKAEINVVNDINVIVVSITNI
jgi:hypothetical protein